MPVLFVQAGRLFVLVSLMLSSQTRDEVNHAAMTRLGKAGLSLAWLNTVPESQLAETIKPVGFWRVRNATGYRTPWLNSRCVRLCAPYNHVVTVHKGPNNHHRCVRNVNSYNNNQ